jgi:CheY-like chemotaxis protein
MNSSKSADAPGAEPTRHFMLVGLDDAQRKRVREAVGARGNSFLVTSRQDEALVYARQIEPSVIVVAAALPDGNCYDLSRQIKEIAGLPHIGVIALGGPADIFDVALGLMAGVDRFVAADVGDERFSELALDLAEKVERDVPLAERPATRRPAKSPPPAPSEAPKPPGTAAPAAAKPAGEPAPPPRPAPAAAAIDPLRDFFVDEPAAAPAAEWAGAATPPTDPLAQRFEAVSQAASEEIMAAVDQWVRFQYGRRIDENLRQEVQRVFKLRVQTIIQNSLKKSVEME